MRNAEVGVNNTLTPLKPIRVTGTAVPGYSVVPAVRGEEQVEQAAAVEVGEVTPVAAGVALPIDVPGLKIAVGEPPLPRFSNNCGAAPVSPARGPCSRRR